MKIQNYRDVKGTRPIPGVVMRVVSGPAEGAPTFVTRIFEIEPGSGTPHHTHNWEHEMFVIEGQGVFKSGNTERPVREGDAITVLSGEQHGVMNTGKNMMRLICVVPLVDGKMPGMVVED